MTRDDIIRLAREAGATAVKFNSTSDAEIIVPRGLNVELFAQLVAAAEREACAQLCEEIAERNKTTDAHVGWVLGNTECADSIRARK